MEEADAEKLRKDNSAAERDVRDGFNKKITEANEELKYFDTVIANYNNKLAFFNTMINVYDDETDPTWAARDDLKKQMDQIYQVLDGFQRSWDSVNEELSNQNFLLFKQEQAWQKAEEAAFKEDVKRAEAQLAEFNVEITELTTMLAPLAGKDASAITAWLADSGKNTNGYKQADIDAANTRKTALNTQKTTINTTITNFKNKEAAATKAKADKETARKAAAA